MVPSKAKAELAANLRDKPQTQDKKPLFTSTTSTAASSTNTDSDADTRGWMRDTLAAIGLTDKSWHQEDTRRPPGSGNIQWILAENWDEEDRGRLDTRDDSRTLTRSTTKVSKSTTPTMSAKTKTANVNADDFVIGVQDWRDTQLLEPKVSTTAAGKAVDKNGKLKGESATSSKGPQPTENALKGGSITPGSGEYDQSRLDHPKDRSTGESSHQHDERKQHSAGSRPRGWFFWLKSERELVPSQQAPKPTTQPSSHPPVKTPKGKPEQEGLWVTLTPTSVSTSPFFDTLLVLVVSPLVTLTVVYGLLLLRSRIRRRRWRAPKSIVERLPVRTYHTMTTSSSTTSSHVASPNHSSSPSPLLLPTGSDPPGRPRPRSQTASSILPHQEASRSLSRSPPSEKPKKVNKRRKYNGRQVECAVCLEDYVDGESLVMSLPCGHEFHADCITPWLVNRRRTCPICKGDVVRSLARAGVDGADRDVPSDDLQSRVAETVSDEPSSAIPIPVHNEENIEDEDVERGQNVEEPLLGRQPVERSSSWRNILATSLSRLSGETVWRQTPGDRSR